MNGGSKRASMSSERAREEDRDLLRRYHENGDTTAGAVTMYRIEQGRERVLDVITPPARLR